MLAVALNYLDQSGEVGGCWNDHRRSTGIQEDSWRRQHALRGESIPSEAQHINGERGEKKIYRPNFFRTTKLRGESLLSGAKRSSRRGAERKKIQSATLNVKVFFPDAEETQQLHS